ncbi:MAG: hydrogenase expression/formation protein HypE [Pseudomonadota bacterium]
MKLSVQHGKVDLYHGSGGRAMVQLIDQIFLREFANPILAQKNDQALLALPGKRIAYTTDSYVVSPLFFAGGDIGSLAVHGTINDLAVGGAEPLYLSVGFILEEGFPLKDLRRIAQSMAKAAKKAGVSIVCADTKVVERGKGDGVFINTSGIGMMAREQSLSRTPQPGDNIIINGYIGDHGTAIISQRENLSFATTIASDSAPLHELTARMLRAAPSIRCMRDATRGGVAAVLNEWADYFKIGVLVREKTLPIRQQVQSACELLGLDPLYLANEGKVIAICPDDQTEALLKAMHSHPLGQKSVIIGQVTDDPLHLVQLETLMGGQRLVDWIAGEQLPRIC